MKNMTKQKRIEELEKLKKVIWETDLVKEAMSSMMDNYSCNSIIFSDGTTTTDCGNTHYPNLEYITIKGWDSCGETDLTEEQIEKIEKDEDGEYDEDSKEYQAMIIENKEAVVDFYIGDKINELEEKIDEDIQNYQRLIEDDENMEAMQQAL